MEEQRDVEVADMAILVCSRCWSVFTERLSTVPNVSVLIP